MPTRVTVADVRAKKARGEPITMLTAYDYSCATWVDRAGVDVVLVGDSLGMVMLGYPTTAPVTMDAMVHHAQAVARAVKRALVVGDLPKQAMAATPAVTLRAARRLMAAGCRAVKIEWRPKAAATVRRLVAAGIPVMGHVGLTPQDVSDSSQFRVRGREAREALRILQAAVELEAAGCFSMVLECVPSPVAAAITERLRIPTIGIGAGPDCDGQVLVLHDVVGLYPLFSPKFAKRYAAMGEEITRAVGQFHADVQQRRFPAVEHSFTMPPAQVERFQALLTRAAAPAGRR